MADNHGSCAHCNFDFNGGSIYEHFLEETGDKEEALRIASMYGATETTGRWGKQIGIYSFEEDRTIHIKCPECGEIQ